jgi:hypothetical protein
MLATMIIGLALALFIVSIGIINAKTRAIRQSMTSLIHFKLLGFISIYISAFFYIDKPKATFCQLRMWLQVFGYCLITSPILAKGIYLFIISRAYFYNRQIHIYSIWKKYGQYILAITLLMEMVKHICVRNYKELSLKLKK